MSADEANEVSMSQETGAYLVKALEGTTVMLKAWPDELYLFKGWEVVSGNRVQIADRSFTETSVKVPNENAAIRAVFEKKSIFFSKNAKAKKSAGIEESCFVCSKVQWGIDHMLETFFTMYSKDEKFRKLFKAQEYVCVPHYNMLNQKSAEKLQKGELSSFQKDLDTLVEEYVKQLNADVNDFCNSFDYRNAGNLHKPEMEHVRSSIERSVEFLTGRKPRVK